MVAEHAGPPHLHSDTPLSLRGRLGSKPNLSSCQRQILSRIPHTNPDTGTGKEGIQYFFPAPIPVHRSRFSGKEAYVGRGLEVGGNRPYLHPSVCNPVSGLCVQQTLKFKKRKC